MRDNGWLSSISRGLPRPRKFTPVQFAKDEQNATIGQHEMGGNTIAQQEEFVRRDRLKKKLCQCTGLIWPSRGRDFSSVYILLVEQKNLQALLRRHLTFSTGIFRDGVGSGLSPYLAGRGKSTGQDLRRVADSPCVSPAIVSS
jgi:hypothetical protein